ncbi:MAG: MFS transporter, partial [Clostridia bacterium]|nr:MFS transporter [Clostridia bacterium]
MAKQNIFQKVGYVVKDFFAHWNTPPKEGYYLSNKEFAAYSIGGMGVQAMSIFFQYFTITVGVHLSVVYDFDQMIVNWTGWIIALLSFVRAPLVGGIMDNTNSKWGKYRPYLLFAGFVCVVCYWMLAFIPNIFMPKSGQHTTEKTKWLVIGSYQIILFIATMAYGFYSFGRKGLAQVMTPNTNERTKLYSVGGVIDSLGPSIVQMFFPVIANAVYGQEGFYYGDKFKGMSAEEIAALKQAGEIPHNLAFGMENIKTYQVLFPIVATLCILLGLVMFFGTKERIIEEKKVKEKVGFLDSIKKSFKNKYFMLFNVARVFEGMRLMIFSATNYVCAYMMSPAIGGAMRGIMPTIASVGYVPGMLFSPIIQKKLGKKRMTIISFAGSTCVSALMLVLVMFAYDSPITPWFYCAGLFLHNIFLALWTVTGPAMTADYCDYQQWKTGDRLDGFMTQTTEVLMTVCGMFTGLMTATILVKIGAQSAADYATPSVLKNVMIFWSISSIVFGIISLIPFFFWDLSEEKQLAMTRDIKIRGLKEKLEDIHWPK